MQNFLDITILCKVVDNFGDIGVVYRLARALSELKNTRPDFPDIKLRIIVDNLKSFSLLEPKIAPEKDFQKCNNWEIYNWNSSDMCFSAFEKNPPKIIFECFQCGRPDWLEKLLFDVKVPNLVDIIMLDYLTAEDYAETFHKLKSLTRSSKVQKVNFMMGFTEKTGGLILDNDFLSSLKNKNDGNFTLKNTKDTFPIVFFSYPRDWTPAVRAFNNFNHNILKSKNETETKKLTINLAKGAGFESFKSACDKMSDEISFDINELPFLSQIEWDSLLVNSPIIFVRGEDSLSRACLCGNPFVWHAYPQTEEYQLVKVKALLDRMRFFFNENDFKIIEKCFLVYNKTNPDAVELESVLMEFLSNSGKFKYGFEAFSNSLLKNGNLAEHIIDFALERQKTLNTSV